MPSHQLGPRALLLFGGLCWVCWLVAWAVDWAAWSCPASRFFSPQAESDLSFRFPFTLGQDCVLRQIAVALAIHRRGRMAFGPIAPGIGHMKTDVVRLSRCPLKGTLGDTLSPFPTAVSDNFADSWPTSGVITHFFLAGWLSGGTQGSEDGKCPQCTSVSARGANVEEQL